MRQSIRHGFHPGRIHQRQFATIAILDYNSVNNVVSLIALGRETVKSCPSFTLDTSKQYVATLPYRKRRHRDSSYMQTKRRWQ